MFKRRKFVLKPKSVDHENDQSLCVGHKSSLTKKGKMSSGEKILDGTRRIGQ